MGQRTSKQPEETLVTLHYLVYSERKTSKIATVQIDGANPSASSFHKNEFLKNAALAQSNFEKEHGKVSAAKIMIIIGKKYVPGFVFGIFTDEDIDNINMFLPRKVTIQVIPEGTLSFSEKEEDGMQNDVDVFRKKLARGKQSPVLVNREIELDVVLQ